MDRMSLRPIVEHQEPDLAARSRPRKWSTTASCGRDAGEGAVQGVSVIRRNEQPQ